MRGDAHFSSTSPFVHHKYSYDKLDRLGSMTANGVTTNYTYDRNGRLLSGNSGGFNTAYTYNLGGMVTGLTTQNGSTAIQSHSYTYLPNGNISGKQSTVGTQTTNYAYQYDKAGRLTNETINSVPTAYTYDAWGNRASITGNGTSSTYTYDANNRLTKSITEEGSTTTTADYYYDHNGNQITKAVNVTTPQSGIAAYFMSPQTNSYLSMYEYDSYNRLKSADADGILTTYAYDGNNLRQSKTSNGITTQHVWDGSNMVMDGTNKFYRGATGIEFASLNGNTSFYHKDAHGDVTALTDSAGTITQSYIYDAFGNQMNENENDINPFRYCGEYLDDETGLIYLRNRYYDNAIGRFITEDPIKDGLNWYAYCGNNPVIFVDPSGKMAVVAVFLGSTIGQQLTPQLTNMASQAGMALHDFVVQNWSTIQQAANYISQYGAAAWDWTTNTAAPWVMEKIQQFGEQIRGGTQKLGNWFQQQWNNATGGDPNNWRNGQNAEDVVNKANHVFNNPEHKLDGFLNRYSGNTVKAYRALTDAAQKYVNVNNVTGNFEQVINVKGYDITIRGTVIDGMARVNTAFIP